MAGHRSAILLMKALLSAVILHSAVLASLTPQRHKKIKACQVLKRSGLVLCEVSDAHSVLGERQATLFLHQPLIVIAVRL